MDNLILGLAAGYHYGDVRPFLASLNDVGYSGRCVLFVTSTTRGIDEMREAGAEVIAFERTGEIAHLSYNAYRYFLYLNYLRAHGPFGRVLVTDVRDVLFQADPFSYPWADGVNVTLEDRRMTIGSCPYVTRWITGHMGESIWESLRDRPISCSGTTVADHAGMLDYLERLTALLVPYEPDRKMMAGYDQGVHNHLIHNDLLPRLTLHDNAGPILTLAYKKDAPAVNSAGCILNDAGHPAVIVHQYDRKPDLFKLVREQYQ
ncbi:hypothetical protein [Desulfovibrio ferrophilus]|uniref:Uncharacterized protein n=1 Tax=Desulfovibrio ferrophilus TaxID=241368 RepID=A0A2Z6AZL1_9BACT|nr:hypothetical protein [Desulfovibrio ferrophilus]BBD08658.1 uncharacterized protein DFE_1932 [Desulfovibrio ferrophilus]